MNNKLIYILGGGIILLGVFYLISPSEDIKNPLNEKKNFKNEKKVVEIKSVKTSPEIQEVKEVKKIKKTTQIKKDKNQEKIEKFIADNNLKSINRVGDMEIFAPNFPTRSEFAPPMPPVMVKLKFKNKEEILPLNADLVNSNKEIYIVRKEGDEYKEIKAIDTKKLKSFTPPSIGGQN